MADAFKMSDLGLLHYYLGIEVRQTYAAKILERSGMVGCNPCQVPMATRLKLSKMSTEPLVDATAYRSIVGSLSPVDRKVVAQSSCEAEYIAAANAACQGVWLARVLAEVHGSAPSVPMLKVDNKSAIALIKNSVLHRHSKHIEVKYYLVRESAEKGQINVEFIRSEEQLGDVLTKPLGKVKFHEFRAKIGLVDVRGKYSKAQEEIVVNREPCTSCTSFRVTA
ncbi:unnamed protein product [Spirodela intermedia]|uniref:Uncharacterized protein n=1 Tax=Spirodela intermedia TaxID=51605 RepID=A0A7I8JQU5_SPIIN|nr:unnamed protein product [Spirodela intermedia]CAA6672141.1 unnamed protein product [Spirodela intermedia]